MAETEDAALLAILALVIFVLYGDHLYHSARLFMRERRIGHFRGLFIAAMLQVGLARITLGAWDRAAPSVLWIEVAQAILAPLLTLLLLTGALVLWWSWRRQ